MNYGLIKPPKNLTNYIRFFWFIEGNMPYVHKAFAYSCPELIFCYKGHFKYAIGKAKDRTFTSGVFGQTEIFSKVTLNNENFGIIGVYLYPQALPLLFDLPASELTNQHADLRSVLGPESEILNDKIVSAETNRQRAKIISDFLLARVKNKQARNPSVSTTITDILTSGQMRSVKQLAGDHCLSLRQFERRFKEMSGFNPKLFLRITRFNSLLNKEFNEKTLTEIGLEHGYYDQAHFIHDFQRFSGINPKEYFNKSTFKANDRGTVEF